VQMVINSCCLKVLFKDEDHSFKFKGRSYQIDKEAIEFIGLKMAQSPSGGIGPQSTLRL
jgi:hypothetical protein